MCILTQDGGPVLSVGLAVGHGDNGVSYVHVATYTDFDLLLLKCREFYLNR